MDDNKPDYFARQRIAELRALFAREEISEANGATAQHDEMGQIIIHRATCGTCGMTWNDALITGRTPVPSARCPYEHIHDEIKELQDLERGPKMTTAQIKIGDVLIRAYDHLGRPAVRHKVTDIKRDRPRRFLLDGWSRMYETGARLSAERINTVERDGQIIGHFFVKYW